MAWLASNWKTSHTHGSLAPPNCKLPARTRTLGPSAAFPSEAGGPERNGHTLRMDQRLKRTLHLLCFSLASSALLACGSSPGALCSRAAECEYISKDAQSECESDIQNAVEQGNLSATDVDQCLGCANENQCGLDIVIDCVSECDAVAPYVFGSAFR